GKRPRGPSSQRFARVLVDDVEKPDLPAVDGDVDLEVQRPHLIRPFGAHPLVAGWAAALLLTHPHRSSEPELDPQPSGALAVDDRALSGGEGVRLAPAPPRMGRRDLP